jgi:hypothetical protein
MTAPESSGLTPLTDDERAELDKLRAAQESGALPDPAAGLEVDAGASLGQMDTAPAEPLPNEAAMDKMMAEFRAMSERVQAMEAELGQAKGDYAAAAASLGTPPVAIYGQAIADKVTSLRAAHPDAPPGHFDALIAKTAPLGQASADLVAGKGHASDVAALLPDVVDAVERFTSRTHPRKWGKPIDFSALLGDLEDATDAADAAAARAS